MDTIISGAKTAYCPKYECERIIYTVLRKHLMFPTSGFAVLRFDCDDENTCEYARQAEFCPFLTNVLKALS